MSDTSTIQDVQHASSKVAEDASSKVGDVAATAKAEVGSVARHARDQAANVLGSTRAQLRTQADEQARSLSQSLEDLARQLSAMAKQNDEPDSQLSQLVGSAGDTLSDRARRLDQDGLDGLVDDVRRLSRNRPVAFLVGSVAVGFGLGRLAKHADLQQIADTARNELSSDDTAQPNEQPSTGHQPQNGALPAPGLEGLASAVGTVGGPTPASEVWSTNE